jgi:hypothetical protein
VFAIGALLVTVFSGSKPAAIAVAACGAIALLFFLLLDLPDANAVGTINDSCGSVGSSFFDAEAVPQGGFFLEMLGAVGLTITGVALATMSPEQLARLRPGRRDEASAEDERAATGPYDHADTDTRRLRTRPRSRQRG